MRIQVRYDENSRNSGQSWRMGEETYAEDFTYDDHGRLTSKTITQADGTETTISNTYDTLSRLSTQTGPISKATYSYAVTEDFEVP